MEYELYLFTNILWASLIRIVIKVDMYNGVNFLYSKLLIETYNFLYVFSFTKTTTILQIFCCIPLIEISFNVFIITVRFYRLVTRNEHQTHLLWVKTYRKSTKFVFPQGRSHVPIGLTYSTTIVRCRLVYAFNYEGKYF